MNYRVEPLGDHDLTRFDCGNTDLNDWLSKSALTSTGQGTRTYVVLGDDSRVVGYFSIAPHLLNRDDAPRRLGRGAPHQIPAILLAKLALDQSLHGRGLGAELLVIALREILSAARRSGGRIVIVDAIDDSAARFYEHHNFQPLPDTPRRLVLKLSTAAQALNIAWP